MKMLGTVILVLSLLSLPLTTGAFWGERETSLVDMRTLVGSPVKSSDGTEAGKVKQLLIDPEDGEIVYAVLVRGGIFGFGGESIAIRWDDLKAGWDKEKLVLTVDKEVLEKATRLEKGKDFDIKGREAQPQKKTQ